MIEHLKKLSPEDVEQFLSTRNPEPLDIHPKLAEYILQLNEAANLLREHKYISDCAEKLKQSYPVLSLSTCKNRIYDAIKYFNNPSNVIADEWNVFFADEMLRLSKLNEDAGDLKEARLAMEKAREYYMDASSKSVHPDRTRFKPQIVSPDIVLERMFIKGDEKDIYEILNKAYSYIDNFDINDTEKQRLFKEVDREIKPPIDIEHEEIG